MNMDYSTNGVRRRLFTLQLRSYIIMVFITMAIVLGAVIIALFHTASNSPLERLPIISRLEGFYIGNAYKWDGVEQVNLTKIEEGQNFWQWSYLVDQNGNILKDFNQKQSNLVGTRYQPSSHDVAVDLVLNGKSIGKIVLNASPFIVRLGAFTAILIPVGVISFFLAIFLIISNYFLVRRIINPLSAMIATAKEVASGNLKARVSVSKPDDLMGLNDTFNQMVEALDETNTNRREFLADIAHELRTPITIMRGRLEGIMDGIYCADDSHIAPILQETYLLERLVDDLRTLTLAETRQLHFDRKSTQLEQVVKNTMDVFSAQAEAQNILINLVSDSTTGTVFADPQRLEQVIGNVLNNSLRHVKKDGKIEIEIKTEGEKSILLISDDGPGVSDEDLPHLFDRFWRKDKSRSRQTGGSGLGLAIAKQLIDGQGGVISASNRPTGGLTIQIELPAYPENQS
jgi:signal transduction histidine kinase